MEELTRSILIAGSIVELAKEIASGLPDYEVYILTVA
jgi:hypothetical protein